MQQWVLPTQPGVRLKPVSLALILAELLDVASTFGGLSLYPQVWESNPLPGLMGGLAPVVFSKLLITVGVALVLEKVERWPGLVWAVPLAASLPVVWNLVCIAAEVLVTSQAVLLPAFGGWPTA